MKLGSIMSDSDEENNRHYDLTSILFGNIDESGQLENDFLDSETKRHLSSLARLGLDSYINELVEEHDIKDKDKPNEDSAEDANHELDYDIKSPTAVDYSDINELAEDITVHSRKNDDSTSDYDADDEDVCGKMDTKLMPPPPNPKIKTEDDGDQDERKRLLETPLAAMLPSKYVGVDVRELFPDFRVDKV